MPDNETGGRELHPDERSAYFNISVKTASLTLTSTQLVQVLLCIQCALTCLKHISCFSYNLAAFLDKKGKLLCEHLSSDKYNNSEKFSTWVSQNKGILYL